jgi:two-component sensor histidine kinase
MRLVNGLLKHQLQGRMNITRDGGTRFTLCWSLREEQGDEI